MICEECKGDTTSSSVAAIAYHKYGPFNHKVIYGINCYKCKTKDTASLIVRVARQLEIDTGTALICVRRRPWCYSKHFRSKPRPISGHIDPNTLLLMNPAPNKWDPVKRLMIGNKWVTPASYKPDLKLEYKITRDGWTIHYIRYFIVDGTKYKEYERCACGKVGRVRYQGTERYLCRDCLAKEGQQIVDKLKTEWASHLPDPEWFKPARKVSDKSLERPLRIGEYKPWQYVPRMFVAWPPLIDSFPVPCKQASQQLWPTPDHFGVFPIPKRLLSPGNEHFYDPIQIETFNHPGDPRIKGWDIDRTNINMRDYHLNNFGLLHLPWPVFKDTIYAHLSMGGAYYFEDERSKRPVPNPFRMWCVLRAWYPATTKADYYQNKADYKEFAFNKGWGDEPLPDYKYSKTGDQLETEDSYSTYDRVIAAMYSEDDPHKDKTKTNRLDSGTDSNAGYTKIPTNPNMRIMKDVTLHCCTKTGLSFFARPLIRTDPATGRKEFFCLICWKDNVNNPYRSRKSWHYLKKSNYKILGYTEQAVLTAIWANPDKSKSQITKFCQYNFKVYGKYSYGNVNHIIDFYKDRGMIKIVDGNYKNSKIVRPILLL